MPLLIQVSKSPVLLLKSGVQQGPLSLKLWAQRYLPMDSSAHQHQSHLVGDRQWQHRPQLSPGRDAGDPGDSQDLASSPIPNSSLAPCNAKANLEPLWLPNPALNPQSQGEEEGNLLHNSKFIWAKLISTGFSPISLFTSTGNSSPKTTTSKQNDLGREKQIQQLNSTPKEESKHREETPANCQQSWGNWGCMTPLEIKPSNVLSWQHPLHPYGAFGVKSPRKSLVLSLSSTNN